MTDFMEKVSVGIIKVDPEKSLEAEVKEVTFDGQFNSMNNKSAVNGPHWPNKTYKKKYVDKPVAADMNKALKMKVKIKITSKNVSGNGKVIGEFKGLEFEGTVPLSNGEHTVDVTLKVPPKELQYYSGSASWGVEGGGYSVPAGTTEHEIFFVFKDPASLPFFSKGVWAEALRYAFENGHIIGEDNEEDAVAKITRMCFVIPYHSYDIVSGAASYGGATKTFKLTQYIAPRNGEVNCYDQSYAVTVFSGALGLDAKGLFLQPFGYIQELNLVGRGRCNNPFPRGGVSNLVVSINDPNRVGFYNHMFCEYGSKIYDACGGPVTGGGDRAWYLSRTIDTTTTLTGSVAGTAAQIRTNSSIGAEVTNVQ